jgi:protein TonB
MVNGKPIDASAEVPITWGSAEPIKPRPKIDPKNPPQIGGAFYPAESKRLNEQGKCKVSVTVTVRGKIRNIRLTESSGFPRLDQACLKALAHGGLLPAIVDGMPVDATAEYPSSGL